MRVLARFQPQLLGILRIVSGLLFLEHGTGKLLHWPTFPLHVAPNLMPVIIIAGIIELLGGVLVTIGLLTRIAAFIMSGEMAVGYWTVHFAQGAQHGAYFPMQNQGDAAILFCFVFLYIASAGPGAWAVDRK
jgi:putative oxidoreductase